VRRVRLVEKGRAGSAWCGRAVLEAAPRYAYGLPAQPLRGTQTTNATGARTTLMLKSEGARRQEPARSEADAAYNAEGPRTRRSAREGYISSRPAP